MAKTTRGTTELATAVADKLGIKDAYTDIDTADQTLILDRYYDRHAEESNDLFFWSVDEEIPVEVFRGVVELIAIDCMPEFGEDVDSVSKEQLAEAAKRRIRKVSKIHKSGHHQEGHYF